MQTMCTVTSTIELFLEDDVTRHSVPIVVNRCTRALFMRSHTPTSSFLECMNTPVPVSTYIMWLLQRKMQALVRRMRNANYTLCLLHQLQTYEDREVSIHNLGFSASDVVRCHVASLLSSPLPPHADVSDVLLRTPASRGMEVSSWMEWQHKYSNHVTFGRTCYSTQCSQTMVCNGVRSRQCTHTKSPSPSCFFAGLPSDCWLRVLDLLVVTPEDVVPLIDVSRAHRTMVQHHPLNTVVLHAYLRERHCPKDVQLRSISSTYQMFAAEVMHARWMDTGTDEVHELYTQMKQLARLWTSTPTEAHSELFVTTRTLDYSMLFYHDFDCLSLGDPLVLSLPPHMFWNGSKNQTLVRRMFQTQSNRHPATIRRVTQDLHRQHFHHFYRCFINDLNNLQYVLSSSLVSAITHIFSPVNTSMKPCHASFDYIMLDDTCITDVMHKMVIAAEGNVTRHNAIASITSMLVNRLASHIDTESRRLHIHRSSYHPVALAHWLRYLRGMKIRRSEGMDVKMRILHRRNQMEGDEAFHVYFGWTSIIPCIGVFVMGVKRVVGAWPMPQLSKHELNACDVVVTWWEGTGWLWSPPDAAPETLEWVKSSDTNLMRVLERHGQITGRCAPCGRPLRAKNKWIGSTCETHVPK